MSSERYTCWCSQVLVGLKNNDLLNSITYGEIKPVVDEMISYGDMQIETAPLNKYAIISVIN